MPSHIMVARRLSSACNRRVGAELLEEGVDPFMGTDCEASRCVRVKHFQWLFGDGVAASGAGAAAVKVGVGIACASAACR